MEPRILSLADVAEVLNVSSNQARALLTSGEIRAFQLGQKRIWRIEATELEAYIERMYAQTEARIARRSTTTRDVEADE